jgi:hypothetical protein
MLKTVSSFSHSIDSNYILLPAILRAMITSRTCRGLLPLDLVLSALLFSSASAELFQTAISPIVQDGIMNRTPSTCPVAQDGYTYNTFPWTHNPECLGGHLPTDDGTGGVYQTFCVYTNVNYNNGRGISFVVSPEVAASVTFETFGMAVGGLEGQIGEEMGMWEVKDTKDRGKGLFARKDIGAIFAGESLIVKTPVLIVAKQFLELQQELVLHLAVDQLPKKTKSLVEGLAKSWGDPAARDIIKTNGIEVKWPWIDENPQLLTVTPEIAVSLRIQASWYTSTKPTQRINHACRPNALWRFNDYTLTFDVFALKDLQPGEEITLSCKPPPPPPSSPSYA